MEKIIILCNKTKEFDFVLRFPETLQVDYKKHTLTYTDTVPGFSGYVPSFVHFDMLEYKPIHGVLFIEYTEPKQTEA